MNRVPLSLWKEVVKAKKSGAIRDICKKLGKDLGPDDPNWIIETRCTENTTGTLCCYWSWDHGEAVKSRWPLFRCACWLSFNKDGSRQAILRFIEHSEPVLTVSFFDLEALIPEPEVYQKLFQWPKIRVSFPESSLGPPRVQDFEQGQTDFSSFSDLQMERVIRIYQACSPVTFWFIEEMALFMHGKAKAKTISNS